MYNMRKLSLFAAASLFAVPFMSSVSSADDSGKVYYDNGTKLETKDFDLKINFEMQPKFSYTDFDGGDDVTSFSTNAMKVIFSGNVLNKQFSFKVESDFAKDNGGSSQRDAWIQWNCSENMANARLGQFKIPLSRQENASSAALLFTGKSLVGNYFAPARQTGAMIHGDVSEGVHYYLGTYNGDSTGEGLNRSGQDNKLAVFAAVHANVGDYGSRAFEGDLRKDTSSTAFTMGVAGIYSENNAVTVTDTTSVTEKFSWFTLNGDVGMRSGGLDVQSEIYYDNINFDADGTDSADDWGFYAQAGYLLEPQWLVGGRFGYLAPDETLDDRDTVSEYSLVVDYLVNGHNLKLQNQVTFEDSEYNDGSDNTTDFRYEFQIAGYF